ncbi:MAG: adenylate/guanylate cyclase domain-containing response regulator, partial [Candidatus Atribacteria bacterium]|nr:adenylate/guanylate cyclase domain-containing response regulator [Candidatus Atribacteria bacterium]
VIGDTVNLASRLQVNAPTGEIMVGERTYQKIKDNFTFTHSRKLKIKGKKDLINAYTLKS